MARCLLLQNQQCLVNHILIHTMHAVQLNYAEFTEWLHNISLEHSDRILITHNLEQTLYANHDYYQVPLEDYLESQISKWQEEEKNLAKIYIQNLDAAGYLRLNLAELPVSRCIAEKTLAKFQRLDPPGIGARSLTECLMVQVECEQSLSQKQGEYQYIIENIAGIRKNKELSLKYQDLISDLQRLNPKPAAHFRHHESFAMQHYDASYKDYAVIYSPNIEIIKNNHRSQGKDLSAQDLLYISNRRSAILDKIINELCKYQASYISGDANMPRPLTVGQLAVMTSMHASVISRGLYNKKIDTPRGIISTKSLINRPVKNSSSCFLIKTINELKLQNKTDKEIALILESYGINIARRTVAKYKALSLYKISNS